MKWVLRNDRQTQNDGRTQDVGETQGSKRFAPRSPRHRSGTSAAAVVLGLAAAAVIGCSAAGNELDITPSGWVEPESGAPETAMDSPAELGTTQSENFAATPAKPAAPSPRTSPRGEDHFDDAPTASQQPPEPAAPGASERHATLHTSGRQLLDTCGKPFVVRGGEQSERRRLGERPDANG